MSDRNTDEPAVLLSPREAAALLPSTSAQTLLRWAKEGLIPYVGLPGGRRSRRFFRREDIEELLTPKVASASSADDSGDGAELPSQEVLSW